PVVAGGAFRFVGDYGRTVSGSGVLRRGLKNSRFHTTHVGHGWSSRVALSADSVVFRRRGIRRIYVLRRDETSERVDENRKWFALRDRCVREAIANQERQVRLGS